MVLGISNSNRFTVAKILRVLKPQRPLNAELTGFTVAKILRVLKPEAVRLVPL